MSQPVATNATDELRPSVTRTTAASLEVQGIADAVGAVGGVARLSGGPFGTVGTYAPGGRITGVRLQPDVVTVRVVARLGVPVHTLAGEVRSVVAARTSARRVDVYVDDVATEPETAGDAATDQTRPAVTVEKPTGGSNFGAPLPSAKHGDAGEPPSGALLEGPADFVAEQSLTTNDRVMRDTREI